MLAVKCCPKCGMIKVGDEDRISNCPRCTTILKNTEERMNMEEYGLWCDKHRNDLEAHKDALRQEYCLNSPQFSQEAWDRRVAEENKPAPAYTPPKPSVKCIACGSTNVQRISAASKVGSVALWGIFAVGKVAKTFKCKDCGMMF